MLEFNWERFGASIRAQAVADGKRWNEIEKTLGISHARLINASQGKPVGVEICLTLCHWLQQDPLWYCSDAQVGTRPTGPKPLAGSVRSTSDAVAESDAPNPAPKTSNPCTQGEVG